MVMIYSKACFSENQIIHRNNLDLFSRKDLFTTFRRYFQAVVKHSTIKMAVDDLNKFYIALDFAIMRYHRDKMRVCFMLILHLCVLQKLDFVLPFHSIFFEQKIKIKIKIKLKYPVLCICELNL